MIPAVGIVCRTRPITEVPVIAVCQQKGGAGKTTLAIHVARGLQIAGHSVLLVDADPQQSASDWYRWGTQDTKPETVGFTGGVLVDDIAGVKRQFDFVVIDTSPRLEGLMAEAIQSADLTLIPTQTSAFDLRAAADVVALFKSARKAKRTKQAAFVVVRPIATSRLAGEIDEALAGFDLPVLTARLGQRVAYMASVGEGATVFETGDRRARAEVTDLTNEIKAMLSWP